MLNNDCNGTRKTCFSRLAFRPNEAASSLGVSRDYFDTHIGPELRWVRRGRLKIVAINELQLWLDRSSARTLPGI